LAYKPFTQALENLLLTGQLSVPHPLVDAKLDRDPARQILESFERDYRLELSGTPPPLDVETALWAAERFLWACQFYVFRDVDREIVLAALAEKLPTELPDELPAKRGPAAHYAVDLVFRFLPDLSRMTAAADPRDVLLTVLKQWGEQWPLSSVGMGRVDPSQLDLEPILSDASLAILYVDRVVAARDRSRAGDPRVHTWLAAIGQTFA
jgi:hypothetical protein